MHRDPCSGARPGPLPRRGSCPCCRSRRCDEAHNLLRHILESTEYICEPDSFTAAVCAYVKEMRSGGVGDHELVAFLELIDEGANQDVDVWCRLRSGCKGYADFSFSEGSQEQAQQKQYYQREAETIPGPSCEIIREAAKKHGMYVQMGMAESTLHSNAIFNSTALIGPEGVVSVYRKMHNPFEWPYFNPGEDAPVAEVPVGNLASVICYDLCFPGTHASLRVERCRSDPRLTAWPMTGHEGHDDFSGWAMDIAAQSRTLCSTRSGAAPSPTTVRNRPTRSKSTTTGEEVNR